VFLFGPWVVYSCYQNPASGGGRGMNMHEFNTC